MGLDDQLTLRSRDLTEQATKSGLGAGMEMHLGLLQQKHGRGIGAKQLGNDGEHLAYTISYVNQIPLESLDFAPRSTDLHLEGLRLLLPERLYRDFIKEAGGVPESLESVLEGCPLLS